MTFLFLSLGSHTHTHFRLNGNFFLIRCQKVKRRAPFSFLFRIVADGKRWWLWCRKFGRKNLSRLVLLRWDNKEQASDFSHRRPQTNHTCRRNETSKTKKMFDARTSSELFDQESLDRVTSFSAVAPIGEAGVWIPVHIAVRIYFYIYRPSEISKTVLPKEWYFTHRQLIEFVSVQRFFF